MRKTKLTKKIYEYNIKQVWAEGGVKTIISVNTLNPLCRRFVIWSMHIIFAPIAFCQQYQQYQKVKEMI